MGGGKTKGMNNEKMGVSGRLLHNKGGVVAEKGKGVKRGGCVANNFDTEMIENDAGGVEGGRK